MEIVKNGVKITCNEEVDEKELLVYLEMENERFPYRKIDELEIKIIGDDVFLLPKFHSIVRLRRITGYLSNIQNFNQAKVEEAHDRIKHIKS